MLRPAAKNVAERASRIRVTPKRLRAAQFSCAPVTAEGYTKIATSISLGLKEILCREEAPAKIWKWVAFGKFLGDRYTRLALALFLRRPAKPNADPNMSPSGWAYPTDVQLGVAEALFLRSPQRAKLTAAHMLPAPGKPPTPDHSRRFGAQWQTAWEAIEATVGTLDRDTFLAEVDRLVALKPKRRPPQKAGKAKSRSRTLNADEAALMRAFRIMITKGGLPLDVAMKEMSNEVASRELTGVSPRRDQNQKGRGSV